MWSYQDRCEFSQPSKVAVVDGRAEFDKAFVERVRDRRHSFVDKHICLAFASFKVSDIPLCAIDKKTQSINLGDGLRVQGDLASPGNEKMHPKKNRQIMIGSQ